MNEKAVHSEINGKQGKQKSLLRHMSPESSTLPGISASSLALKAKFKTVKT